MPNDLLTVAQVAELLDMSAGAVRKAINQGRLPAVRFSPRVMLIRRNEAEHYRTKPKGAGGRPRKPEGDIQP